MQGKFIDFFYKIRGFKGTAKMRFCRTKKCLKMRQNYLPSREVTQKKAPEKAGERGKLPSY